MERRLIVFLVLSMAVLLGYSNLMQHLHPPKPRPKAPPPAQAEVEREKPADKAAEEPKSKPPETTEKSAPAVQTPSEPDVPPQWLTLGSADPKSPYRMLVTLSNRGAAVARIELNSPNYCDIDYRGGYLGHVAVDSFAGSDVEGCLVQVVGSGTPAAEAGLKPGDVITAVGEMPVRSQSTFEAAMAKTRPRRKMTFTVLRDGKTLRLGATLRRRPLEVVKPEADDPLSMLLTLDRVDDLKLTSESGLFDELEGVDLRRANWRVVESDADHAVFRRTVAEWGLEITKTYRLAQVPEAARANKDFPAYHLEFDVEIRNLGGQTRTVAYRLDGPNGLPTEGRGEATRATRSGGSGLRDFIISFGGATPGMVGATTLAADKAPPPWPDQSLTFIGVDAQYFSAVLMPRRKNPAEVWFEELMAIRAGAVDKNHPNLTNASCRLIGKAVPLKPGGSLLNQFKLFAGPKKPSLLENDQYRLGDLVYYGWPIFAMVAVPLAAVLHGFYLVVGNYGLAIILLTVFVRLCMFPLSRKQVLGMLKMQELQPEIKKIQEKHKNNAEARGRAQQELFRKHNYNPLSGCLPIFIQMPVFIGLYRALMVAIELRDAPLATHGLRWCSNLAAPDMLFNWSGFMPSFIVDGPGILWLGPFFNLLPILTVALFIWQQKTFTPPAADEQAAMQQKIMQYMMIFMGLLFFKVASGLCIYFIASSLWGIAERRFMPKPPPKPGAVETRAQAKARQRSTAKK